MLEVFSRIEREMRDSIFDNQCRIRVLHLVKHIRASKVLQSNLELFSMV